MKGKKDINKDVRFKEKNTSTKSFNQIQYYAAKGWIGYTLYLFYLKILLTIDWFRQRLLLFILKKNAQCTRDKMKNKKKPP